jgi:PhnB protein
MPEDRSAWVDTALADLAAKSFQSRLREELERMAKQMATQTTTIKTGVPAGYTTVTPYVTVTDIERLIAFTKDAFGAVETHRSTTPAGGTHCELRIGDSMLMCGGGAPAQGREKLNVFHIYVPDVDKAYRQAIESGAESAREPADQPYGERNSGVKDPVGNQWFIATRLSGVPAPEGMRTVTPYLHQENTVEFIEFLKRAFDAREEGVYKGPDGKVMHAAVWVGNAMMEMGDTDVVPAAFYLYVPDADAAYQQALAAGAKSLYAPVDHPYGDRSGGVEDAWGHTWYIATRLGA